jgi:L-aspartate oxidase
MTALSLPGANGCPVIIGGGLAGLMTALHLAPQPVLVLSRAPLGDQAASAWAQGGLAAAIGGDDNTDLHLADTLAAGDGLCDPAVARRIVESGPALIEELCKLGARFDRDARGRIGVGLEAGHSRRRIVHAMGDSSGREILRAVIAAVRRTPSITVWEGAAATRLLTQDGTVSGVMAVSKGARPVVLRSSRVVIATGGLGGLYDHTTNPSGAIGQGLMLAARAGAALADLEFVQFHPTALDVGLDPMPLVSEAVRGEGAILIDEAGERFMAGQGRAELEPRDVVSRAVWAHMQAGHRVFLDARPGLVPHFARRFPAIAAACLSAGIDPETAPIPVRPAAHYHMGGIAVSADGRSTLPGLWACGEVASTGLHGANRLASNSLLEAAATGRMVAESIAGTESGTIAAIALVEAMPKPDASLVRPILSRHAGVLRDEAGLNAAIDALAPLAWGEGASAEPACLALMMVVAMRRRQESRGGHARTDYPGRREELASRWTLSLEEVKKVRGAATEAPRQGGALLKPSP